MPTFDEIVQHHENDAPLSLRGVVFFYKLMWHLPENYDCHLAARMLLLKKMEVVHFGKNYTFFS